MCYRPDILFASYTSVKVSGLFISITLAFFYVACVYTARIKSVSETILCLSKTNLVLWPDIFIATVFRDTGSDSTNWILK